MDKNDALAAAKAVEQGEAPSGSVVIALTGPNSLATPGPEADALNAAVRDASQQHFLAGDALFTLNLKALAVSLLGLHPTARYLELTEGDQSEHAVIFYELKDAEEVNLDVDELDDEEDDRVRFLEDWRLDQLIGIVRVRQNGRTPIWVIDLLKAAKLDAEPTPQKVKPMIEMVIVRDPDGGVDYDVFLDGVKVEPQDLTDYVIDAGRGHDWADWADIRDANMASASSRAVRAALIDAYTDPPGGQYIGDKPRLSGDPFEEFDWWAPADYEAPLIRVISENLGLVWTGTDPDKAEEVALMAAVNTGRTVYKHEGEEND